MKLLDKSELKPLTLSSIGDLVKASKGSSEHTGELQMYYIDADGWGVCQSNVYSEYKTEALFTLSDLDGMNSNEILDYLQDKLDNTLSEYFTLQEIEILIEKISEDYKLKYDDYEIILLLENEYLETISEIKNYIIRNYTQEEEE